MSMLPIPKTLFALVFIVLVAVPLPAGAAPSLLDGLVPQCGTVARVVNEEKKETTSTYTPCDTCDFAVLVKNILDFIWQYVALFGVALMLMVGGFQMVAGGLGGSSEAYRKGGRTIKNAFIGLAIVFVSWLVIDTVIKFIAQRGSVLTTTPAEIPKKIEGAFQEGPLVEPARVAYGFWNELECTRLREIQVTTKPPPPIPAELQCVPGEPRIVDGFDTCDENVRRAMQNSTSVKGPVPDGHRCDTQSRQRFAAQYGTMAERVAREEGVPPEYLKAILLIESNGRNFTNIGPAGEVGIAQVLISTARGVMNMQNRSNAEIADWLRVEENSTRAGARVLRAGLQDPRINGNVKHAFATYNAGLGALRPSKDCPGLTQIACPINPGGLAVAQDYGERVAQCVEGVRGM